MTIPSTRRSLRGLLQKAVLAGAFGFMLNSTHAQITTVFYVLLENRCFTSGADKSYNNVIFQNPAAPYLTSLCTPGSSNPATAQSSFCSAYHNALANTAGSGTSIHPSEPNYIWMEAGSNLSKADDNDPYGTGKSVLQIYNYLQANPNVSGECITGLLQNAGITWKSYQEGTNLLNSSGQNFNTAGGTLTNNIVPVGQRTVPLASFSGTSASYTNQYNHSHQYNYAAKHCGSLFFPATNGCTVTTADTTPNNVVAYHYAPLEDLTTDLNNNTVAQYNIITPDQYNDGHTALSGNFVYNGTTYAGGSDLARVAQMDNFCAILVPQIMASQNYQAGHTAIVIWTDETEGNPQNDYYHTLTQIVISPLCKGNAYNGTLNYTHSSDIATFQKVFGVTANTPTGYLNDAANASNVTVGSPILNTGQGLQPAATPAQPFYGFGTGTAQDLSDLFVPGTIPASLPGLNLTPSGFAYNRKTNTYSQTVTVTNALSEAITKPIYLVVGNLSNATLANSAGTTVNNFPGNPYVSVSPTGLAAGASAVVTLQFSSPTGGGINETMSAINTTATP